MDSQAPKATDVWITFSPLFAIALLALYMLLRLITGVIAFQDCPEASKELEDQVVEARTEMKKRGVI